ncbi:hypothetical protein CEUSTIGMA_g12775.t1 [Chlamydomonas eustigma]|uniref:Uncharacterized protein n=1 Tax=Chlamydomonas eustigma TaxID=1157962 RepID=A0A250XQM5_9CHLO|nr:hypothetical protein CEUSTIGMA_g12775.t1 [Chlamydomonas eustigma]|eukprot:GAX85358.1 hypothetical protein CEUSTIGMA_g12775.t1 [Chlamydomonas eustigma]
MLSSSTRGFLNHKSPSLRARGAKLEISGKTLLNAQNELHSGLYQLALQHARVNDYDAARTNFRHLTASYPAACKCWVSWAQMEKRVGDTNSLNRCREVLQRGLELNKQSACIMQAWGLLELQQGNFLPALKMLERAAMMHPNCSPVLKWEQVATARKTVSSKKSRASA